MMITNGIELIYCKYYRLSFSTYFHWVYFLLLRRLKAVTRLQNVNFNTKKLYLFEIGQFLTC